MPNDLKALISNYNQSTEITNKNLKLANSVNTVPEFVVTERTLFGDQAMINQQVKTDFSKIGTPIRENNPLALTLPATQMIESINPDTDKRVLYVNGVNGQLVRNRRGNYNISINGDQQFMQGIDLSGQGTDQPVIIELPNTYNGQASTTIRCGGVLEQPAQPMTGAGETIRLPIFAGSHNNNIGSGDLLIPEDVTQARLVPGSKLRLQSSIQNTPVLLEYGGVIRTHKISPSYRVFDAQSSSTPFAIGGGLAEGNSIKLQINGQDISTFVFRLAGRIEDNEFSSLDTLYTLLSRVNSLSVRMVEGTVYIGAKNPNDSVVFTDNGGTIGAMLGLTSNDIPAAAAGVQRFNSLASLNEAINRLGHQNLSASLGTRSVSFAAASFDETLNVDASSNNTWFTASQAIITENATGMIQIIAPELLRRGIEVGDTVQVDGYQAAAGAVNAAGTQIALQGRLKILKTDPRTGAIFVSTGQNAHGVTDTISAITKPFKLRKIVGSKSIKNFGNISASAANAVDGDYRKITFTYPGHGITAGSQLYIPNLPNAIKARNLSDEASIAANTLVQVSAITDNTFTVSVLDPKNELDGLGGQQVDLENIQIVTAELAVMTSYSNKDNDKGLIKVYQPRAGQTYATGDKIAFRNLATAKTFIGAVNGNYIEQDTDYIVKSVGQDAQGEFFVITAGNDGNVGGLGLVNYNTLGANSYVEHISELAAYFGISRSKLGNEGNFGPAYDVTGITAPNLTQASFDPNPALKEQLRQRTTTVLSSIIDDQQATHNYKISLLPLSNKNVQIEIAILKDASGQYNCAGVDEEGDGIIASGQLRYVDGVLDSTLPDNIALNWTGPTGEKLATNILKFDFQNMELLHGVTTTVAQNISDETGRKPIQLEDATNILLGDDGVIQVQDREGNTTTPIYQLVLYRVDNPENLKAAPGTSGYMTSHASGSLRKIDQNNIKVQSHSSYSSGIDITEQQINSMNYARYVQACFVQQAADTEFKKNIDSIIRNIIL